MKTVLAAALALLPCAAAARGDVVAVLELRSRVPGDSQPDSAALTEQVRGVARRALPEARVLTREETLALPGGKDELKVARGLGADRIVTGEILRIDDGFLVTLALRETKEDKLVATASGTGSTKEELLEAATGAAVDLFRAAQPVPAGLAIGPAPEKPAAPGPLPEEDEVLAEASALVAYDKAQTAEASGKDRPDLAAAAWHELAELGGANPFREVAEMRARQWETYAETRHAYEAQLARDTGQLHKILPLASVNEKAKLDLIVRFARAYGAAEAAPLVALLPAPALRQRAGLALGCEAKDASQCLLLARAADAANDASAALDYLEQACDAGAGEGDGFAGARAEPERRSIGDGDGFAGARAEPERRSSGDACAEAGDRWLSPSTRDVSRALAALQRGCAAKNGQACARLARVYEEGDGTDVNLILAAEVREKACSAGDGRSCRRLACSVEAGTAAADQARALDLWQQGCAHGDSISCALAQLSAAKPAPQTATAAAPPPPARAAPAVAAAQPAEKPRARSAVGGVLVGLGLAAAGGAVFLANSDDGHGSRRYGRNYEIFREPGGPSHSGAKLLGAAAVISGAAGVMVLLSGSPDPATPKVAVGVAPSGVALSGNFK